MFSLSLEADFSQLEFTFHVREVKFESTFHSFNMLPIYSSGVLILSACVNSKRFVNLLEIPGGSLLITPAQRNKMF